MPKYKFTALAPDGTTVSGTEEALTATLARASLAGRQLEPVELQERKSVLQFEITKKRVSRKDLMHFSRQLAVFLRAGIPILDALEVIAEESADKLFKQSLRDMADALRAGDTFAGAAMAHPEAFPESYLGILRSAELTGNLDTVLDQLAEYIDRDLEARRRITSALVYPGVVLAMSIVTVLILTVFVLPRFKTFFRNLDAQLPLATRILLNITDFLSTWWFVFAGLAGALVVFLAVGLRTARGKRVRDVVVLHLPVLGDLVRHAVLERFCRILSSMVQAGVPLPEALAVTGDGTNNAVFKKGLADARERMLRGEGLAVPLSDTG